MTEETKVKHMFTGLDRPHYFFGYLSQIKNACTFAYLMPWQKHMEGHHSVDRLQYYRTYSERLSDSTSIVRSFESNENG
jgi:hypothetical protein